MKKMGIRHILYLSYLLLLAFSYFYINSVLSSKEINVRKSVEKNDSKESKYVNVSMFFNSKEYRVKLKSSDTVYDLLNEIWDGYGVYYEKTDYSNAIELDFVNGIKSSDGKKWRILNSNNNDITNEIELTTLNEDDEFFLIQVDFRSS